MVKKSSLASVFKMSSVLDSSVCAYMAVQIPAGKAPVFYRSSSLSFIQTKGFNPVGVRHFVSYSHLQDCLRASADSLEMSVDAMGIVCIESVDGPYRNFMHVHTVREVSTGIKYHSIGEPAKERLDPIVFSGIDVEALPELSGQPSLGDGKLYLGTQAGVVKWQVPDSIRNITLQPRKSFLSFVSGGVADALTLSENGYWVAHKDGMVGCFSSHTSLDPMRQIFNVPGTVFATVDAARLVSALKSIVLLCEKSSRVEFSPTKGLSCRDKYGNEATLNLGPQASEWAKFATSGSTAELLVSALSQSADKDAVFQSITPLSGPAAMRISRGNFEIDVRVIP
jgi:hypothetical protein